MTDTIIRRAKQIQDAVSAHKYQQGIMERMTVAQTVKFFETLTYTLDNVMCLAEDIIDEVKFREAEKKNGARDPED